MGERECKIKGYVGRKGIWDREFGNAIWGERGYGKRGDTGIWEERANGNIGTSMKFGKKGKGKEEDDRRYGDKEKWMGRESGKKRKCGGGEREVERKRMWVYRRKGT